MGFFTRMFKMGQSEAHDKLEDPIKLTEQGIRDLKKDLEGSIMNLAGVKASDIKLKKDVIDGLCDSLYLKTNIEHEMK